MDMAGPSNSGSGQTSSSDFVRKLYKMLEDPSYRDIVRWNEQGDSFIVLDTNEFTKNILPRHFKHSNFASFVRQLNKYDFHKVRNTEESSSSQYAEGAWEFHHPFFQSNNKDMLDNIKRKAPAPRKAASTQLEEGMPMNDDLAQRLHVLQQGQEDLGRRILSLSTSYNLVMNELQSLSKKVDEHSRLLANTYATRRPFPGDENGMDPGMRQHRQVMDNGAMNMGSDDQFSQSHHGAPNNVMNNAVTPIEQAQRFLKSGSIGGKSIPQPPGNPSIHVSPQEPMNPNQNQLGHSNAFGYQGGNFPTETPTIQIDQSTMFDIHNDPQFGLAPDTLMGRHRQRPMAARKKSTMFNPLWVRKPRILLVEDDQVCRRIGQKFLGHANCESDTCADGLAAIEKVKNIANDPKGMYDLILMDIIMPRLDGTNACKAIRQEHPDMRKPPIIAMTSNIRTDDINNYFNNGMIDVLPKPFTKEGLLSMLQKHLAKLVVQPNMAANMAGDGSEALFDTSTGPTHPPPISTHHINSQSQSQTTPTQPQSARSQAFSQTGHSQYHPFPSQSEAPIKLSDTPPPDLNVFGEPTLADDDENTTGPTGNTPETSLGLGTMATGLGGPLDLGLSGDEYTYMNPYGLDHGGGSDILAASGFHGGMTRRYMHEMDDFERGKRPKFAGTA